MASTKKQPLTGAERRAALARICERPPIITHQREHKQGEHDEDHGRT
jgi:hypothetical protein